MSDKKKKLKLFFDKLHGDYPERNKELIKTSKNFKSLLKIANDFGVGRTWLNDIWLKKYLNQKFGFNRAKIIKSCLWPPDSKEINEKKKIFRKKISSLLKKYPEDIENIVSINKLALDIGITKITLLKWIPIYLNQNYSPDVAKKIYYEIWKSRKGTERKLKYEDIKSSVENKGGKLITKYDLFIKMKEKPSQRYVDIKCKHGHKWKASVLHLLYHERWCPVCNEYKCQKLLRSFMEKIFGVRFYPEITLKKAYGISKKAVQKTIINKNRKFQFVINIEKLRYDGYYDKILLKGCDGKVSSFRVAFEYDGIHHDEFPNTYHKTLEEFCLQQARDQLKNLETKHYNTILIRLKRINGFDQNTFKHNPTVVQKEVMRQFNNQVQKFFGNSKICLNL